MNLSEESLENYWRRLMTTEKEHLKKLNMLTVRRLRILEAQQTTMGAICPPGIVAEIEDTKEEIRKRNLEIRRYTERELQLLKEKQAIFGISVDPSVLIQIEDLEKELKELQ